MISWIIRARKWKGSLISYSEKIAIHPWSQPHWITSGKCSKLGKNLGTSSFSNTHWIVFFQLHLSASLWGGGGVSSRALKGFHVKKQLETILSRQEKQICARVSHLKFWFQEESRRKCGKWRRHLTLDECEILMWLGSHFPFADRIQHDSGFTLWQTDHTKQRRGSAVN